MDVASARPSRSWEDIKLYRHPGNVPGEMVIPARQLPSPVVEVAPPRRTTHVRNPPALSAGGDYLMRAHTGEWMKIVKTAKGFRMPPGTRLADIVDRKVLWGQAACWKSSALVPEDHELSWEVVFVSVVIIVHVPYSTDLEILVRGISVLPRLPAEGDVVSTYSWTWPFHGVLGEAPPLSCLRREPHRARAQSVEARGPDYFQQHADRQ